MAGTMSTEERAADLAANKQAVAEVSDADLYSSAIEETSPATTEETEHKPDATGRLHAPDGKFAPKAKAEDADAAPTQQQPEQALQEAKDEAQVPSWRLRELREQREAAEQRAQEASRQAYEHQQQLQALQRELAELRKPKTEIDFFADPNAAIKQSLDPLQGQFQSEVQDLRRELSEARAIARYGVEAFDAMQEELNSAMSSRDPDVQALRLQVANSRDPAAVAMQWFQQRKVLKEVGNDPAAYKTKLTDELLKDPTFLAKAMEAAKAIATNPVNGSSPKVQLPPSLNRVAAAARSTGDDEGDMSDQSLYRHALR